MNEREFIELLNLYLDDEISSSEAARFEVEIRRNEKRRKIYWEYCRMQKACRRLATEFSSATAPEDRLEARPAMPVSLANRGGRTLSRQWILRTCGLLAAASLALFAYINSGTRHATKSAVDDTPGSHAYRVASGSAGLADNAKDRSIAVATVSEAGAGMSPALISGTRPVSDGNLGLSLSRAQSLAPRLVYHKDDQLDWVRQFQIVPLTDRNRVSLPRFEVTPQALHPDVRAIRLGAPLDPVEEIAAFRFIK